jgi:hypothetical protein
MRYVALCGLVLASTAAAGEDGWKPLFNGKDLSGWKHVGEGGIVVENGAIATSGKGMGLLYWTGGKIGRAQIRVVYRTSEKPGNSGVFIRIPVEPREAWMPVHYGYEVNIESDPARWNEDDYYGTGSLYSFTKILSKADKPGPEWNEMVITIDGPRAVVHVNGVKVTDYKEGDPLRPPHKGDPLRGPRPDEGWIGLQNEGEPVYFREVSMRPLTK